MGCVWVYGAVGHCDSAPGQSLLLAKNGNGSCRPILGMAGIGDPLVCTGRNRVIAPNTAMARAWLWPVSLWVLMFRQHWNPKHKQWRECPTVSTPGPFSKAYANCSWWVLHSLTWSIMLQSQLAHFTLMSSGFQQGCNKCLKNTTLHSSDAGGSSNNIHNKHFREPSAEA